MVFYDASEPLLCRFTSSSPASIVGTFARYANLRGICERLHCTLWRPHGFIPIAFITCCEAKGSQDHPPEQLQNSCKRINLCNLCQRIKRFFPIRFSVSGRHQYQIEQCKSVHISLPVRRHRTARSPWSCSPVSHLWSASVPPFLWWLQVLSPRRFERKRFEISTCPRKIKDLATKRFWKRKKLPSVSSVSSDFFVYSHCSGNGSSMFQPCKEPGASHHLHSVPQNLWLLSLDSITCIHLHGWRLMELGQEGLKPPDKLVVPCPRHNITVTRIQGDWTSETSSRDFLSGLFWWWWTSHARRPYLCPVWLQHSQRNLNGQRPQKNHTLWHIQFYRNSPRKKKLQVRFTVLRGLTIKCPAVKLCHVQMAVQYICFSVAQDPPWHTSCWIGTARSPGPEPVKLITVGTFTVITLGEMPLDQGQKRMLKDLESWSETKKAGKYSGYNADC